MQCLSLHPLILLLLLLSFLLSFRLYVVSHYSTWQTFWPSVFALHPTYDSDETCVSTSSRWGFPKRVELHTIACTDIELLFALRKCNNHQLYPPSRWRATTQYWRSSSWPVLRKNRPRLSALLWKSSTTLTPWNASKGSSTDWHVPL